MSARRQILLVVAVGAVLVLANATGSPWSESEAASAADGGPEMRLAIPGGDCANDVCTVPSGASFILAVEVVGFPKGGYALAQTYIDMGTELIYKPADTAGDEFVWPTCLTAVALRGNLNDTGWLHGCITGLLPPLPASTYAGTLLELKMTCSESDSTTEVQLIPSGEAPAFTNGAVFSKPNGDKSVPKTNNLTIRCGSGPPPPDTGTRTPTQVPPTSTPPPTSASGDANCDGTVNPLAATLILQFGAGLLDALPCGDRADINGDGQVNALDATLILQFTAGLIQQLPIANNN